MFYIFHNMFIEPQNSPQTQVEALIAPTVNSLQFKMSC